MIIDFHTHIFPDDLAPRALASLKQGSGGIYTPVTDMTRDSLLSYMDQHSIDMSVVMPIVTKQTQFFKTNQWAKSLESDRMIPFGSIYPHTENYKADIDFLVELGFRGIKFHAEYQDFILDEPKMLKIYDYALSKGLILLHHAGFDPAYPPPYRSSPRQFANVVDAMQGGIIVAAHLGGHDQWDDVEQYLVGKNIYLDTAMGFAYYGKAQFLRILNAHGADKILFASDSPWSDASNEIAILNSLPISQADKEKVLGLNAKRILALSSQ